MPKDGCLVLVTTLPPTSIGTRAGVFAIGILGRLTPSDTATRQAKPESNDPSGSRLDCPHGSDLG